MIHVQLIDPAACVCSLNVDYEMFFFIFQLQDTDEIMFKDNTKQEGFNVLFTFQNLTEKKRKIPAEHIFC